MAEERNIELPDVDLDAALAEAMSGSGGLSTKIPTLNELTESINIGWYWYWYWPCRSL
jgi:hypothetical protein